MWLCTPGGMPSREGWSPSSPRLIARYVALVKGRKLFGRIPTDLGSGFQRKPSCNVRESNLVIARDHLTVARRERKLLACEDFVNELADG